MSNLDKKTVDGFGKEWKSYDQKNFTGPAYQSLAEGYFEKFPFHKVNALSQGFDMGCGSGRWARFIAPHVGRLNCIDPSNDALLTAKVGLSEFSNCSFECASANDTNLEKGSQDFGYSLGVLHHIPDTQLGLNACSDLLKPGAPFLLYLYYKFDDKPLWFKIIWRVSDLFRRVICLLPFPLKKLICYLIALLVYLPMSRLARGLESLGINIHNLPLSAYRNQPFYTLATDALDRFGTRLEQRFTKEEIETMMCKAGFKNIEFNDPTPGWICIGYKN
jgi:SAM-dependent methyltransferase